MDADLLLDAYSHGIFPWSEHPVRWYCPEPRRSQAWGRLARDLPLDKLDRMTRVHPLAEVPALAAQILAGQIQGRAVIDLASD